MVEMVDVMVADVGTKPTHDRAGFEMAGRYHSSFFKCPAGFIVEDYAGEIVLGIKKVGSERTTQQPGKNQSQQHGPPPGYKDQCCGQGNVQYEGQQAIVML